MSFIKISNIRIRESCLKMTGDVSVGPCVKLMRNDHTNEFPIKGAHLGFGLLTRCGMWSGSEGNWGIGFWITD